MVPLPAAACLCLVLQVMPWWAIIYLLVFIAFSFVGDILGKFDGTKRLRRIADLLTGVTFATLFAGFWLMPIHRALGIAAPLLFVAATAWECCTAPSDLRKIWRDTELSRRECIGLTLLAPLLAWPLCIIAGIGVWKFHVHPGL